MPLENERHFLFLLLRLENIYKAQLKHKTVSIK